MRLLLILLILSIDTLCYAAIYKQTDRNGNIIYSDIPVLRNAKTIRSSNSSTEVKSLPPSPVPESKPPVVMEKPPIPYTLFQISSPKDQETIQNQPVITVNLLLKPELQMGDQVQLFVDSKPWGNPTISTQIELVNMDRGIHRLYALLLDDKQTILKQTNIITIYVHHASINSINATINKAP